MGTRARATGTRAAPATAAAGDRSRAARGR
jgi:hypothetical protein